jgi:hypothetical protein
MKNGHAYTTVQTLTWQYCNSRFDVCQNHLFQFKRILLVYLSVEIASFISKIILVVNTTTQVTSMGRLF